METFAPVVQWIGQEASILPMWVRLLPGAPRERRRRDALNVSRLFPNEVTREALLTGGGRGIKDRKACLLVEDFLVLCREGDSNPQEVALTTT